MTFNKAELAENKIIRNSFQNTATPTISITNVDNENSTHPK
jgi:hypothetical protein